MSAGAADAGTGPGAGSSRPIPEDVETVAIVGGGAAGLITAHQLLNGPHAGDYDITIYEREAAPYTTLCGEGISHSSLSRFKAFDSFPHTAEEFPGAAWYFPGDVKVHVEQRGYTLERATWIPAMAESVQKLGATYKTGHKVSPGQVEEMARDHDVVIGADGPGSQVRKTMPGVEATTMLGIQYRVAESPYETDLLEFYTDKRYSPEYSWIFPKGSILNVGLLARGDGQDWDRLDAFMEDKAVGGKVVKREAYPIGFFGNAVQQGNKLLIGDAGGLTNPVTKGGLTAIIYASEILAECLAKGEGAEYNDRVFSHPITDPAFREAVEIIHKWSNRDFEKLARFAPREMRVGEGVNARKRYVLPLLAAMATNPGKIRAVNTLAHAMGVSRRYSW